MSKFSFTGPNGKPFEIVGPPGATLEQARAIFEEQARTGSLVGLSPGDVVSAATQAAGGLKSAISQLETVAGDGLGLKLPSLGLENVPIVNGINAADFIKQGTPSFGLGPLSPPDLQGLMSQAAASIGQPPDKVSAATGIGKFGLDLDKLEVTGFLKPGTAESYAKTAINSVTTADIDEAAKINAAGGNTTPEEIARNRQLNSFLTPAAFTGKDGVSDLTGILADENIQNKIQGDVLKQSFSQISEAGLLSQLPDAKQVAATLQTAATFGIDTAKNLVDGKGLSLPTDVKEVARAAEFAKSFSDKFADVLSSGSPLEAGIKAVTGSTNRVNRETVDASFTSLLNNPKIPTPAFSSAPPATTTTAVATADFRPRVSSLESRFTPVLLDVSDLQRVRINNSNRQKTIDTATALLATIDRLQSEANALIEEIVATGGNAALLRSLRALIDNLKSLRPSVETRLDLASSGFNVS